MTAPGAREVASWPLDGVGRPDLAAVDELARLQLAVRRAGCTLELRDACAELVALLALTGLGLEVFGQAEGGEERRVEEEVQPDDLTT